MAVNLSPIWGAGAQLLDNSGNVLTGGKIYTYLAGTTTPATTYTSSNGNTANSNPIILNSAGRVPYEIWLTDSIEYKFVLKDSNDTLIGTWDNLVGINSNFINYYGQQEIQTATAGQTVFTLADFEYQPGTGNLSVFVDGVNQYGPGAQYAFIETNSTTVTFVSGLHVGASVKFTTTKLENPTAVDASQVSYTYPDANAVPENVEARLAQYVSVKDFGAVGDGITDDYDAWNNAVTYCAANGLQLYAPSTDAFYNIGTSLEINCAFYAGLYHVFGGAGTITFDPAYLEVGYPEWWGAVTGGADCLDAISACIVACRVTQLQCSDYFISDTLKIQTRSKTLRGAGFNYLGNDTGSATRVIVSGGSKDVIQIGPDTQPGGGINSFLSEVTVQNLQVSRDAVPVTGSGCSGIKNQFTLYSYIEKVKSVESMYGFHYTGTVQAHTVDCFAFRSSAGSGVAHDLFWGYYVDGISNNIGAAGGNASIYFDTCNASCAGSAPSDSSGVYLNGKFTDCYIANCELNGMAFGIAVIGNGNTSQNYDALDLQITSCVIDVFTFAGIYFKDITKYGAISVNGGYCAPSSSSSTVVAGLYFSDSYAQVSVTDFQTICTPNALCSGITAINAANIETKTQIIGSVDTAVGLTNVTNSRFLDHVTNYGVIGGPVCQLTGCSRNYLQIFATGAATNNAFTLGYQGISSANVYNEFNCTGLDSAAIAGGSTNKLNLNGVATTTVGPCSGSTTNYASGVMG